MRRTRLPAFPQHRSPRHKAGKSAGAAVRSADTVSQARRLRPGAGRPGAVIRYLRYTDVRSARDTRRGRLWSQGESKQAGVAGWYCFSVRNRTYYLGSTACSYHLDKFLKEKYRYIENYH